MIIEDDGSVTFTAAEKEAMKAERLAKKEKFDAKAKRHLCFRCHERKTVASVTRSHSMKVDVLKHKLWLCHDCSIALGKWFSEIQDARRESERPSREAEAAQRKAELSANLAEKRERLDAERASKGLAPLAKPRSKGRKPPKPR